MAVHQLLSTLPQIKLERGYVVQFEAIDPSTGLAVTGVTVNNVSLTTDQEATFGPTDPQDTFPLLLPSADS